MEFLSYILFGVFSLDLQISDWFFYRKLWTIYTTYKKLSLLIMFSCKHVSCTTITFCFRTTNIIKTNTSTSATNIFTTTTATVTFIPTTTATNFSTNSTCTNIPPTPLSQLLCYHYLWYY